MWAGLCLIHHHHESSIYGRGCDAAPIADRHALSNGPFFTAAAPKGPALCFLNYFTTSPKRPGARSGAPRRYPPVPGPSGACSGCARTAAGAPPHHGGARGGSFGVPPARPNLSHAQRHGGFIVQFTIIMVICGKRSTGALPHRKQISQGQPAARRQAAPGRLLTEAPALRGFDTRWPSHFESTH